MTAMICNKTIIYPSQITCAVVKSKMTLSSFTDTLSTSLGSREPMGLRNFFVLIFLLLPGLTGCATFVSSSFSSKTPWPKIEADRPIRIKIVHEKLVYTLNGEKPDENDKNAEKFYFPALLKQALESETQYQIVQDNSHDILIRIQQIKKIEESPTYRFFASATAYTLPYWSSEDWQLKVAYKKLDSEKTFETVHSAKFNSWRQILLLPLYPFFDPHLITYETRIAAFKNSLQQAQVKGFFEVSP